jgi:large subunit ribosomal protein L10
MVTLNKKKDIVALLVEKFQKADAFYLVDLTGMTVADSFKLRRELKGKTIELKVARNTLINLALNQIGNNPVPADYFKGQTSIMFCYDDPTVAAKLIKEKQDKNAKMVFKAAVIEGVFYDKKQLATLATLPSKTDLMSSIVGSLHAPITGIVGSINAVMRDLASIIEEVAKKSA